MSNKKSQVNLLKQIEREIVYQHSGTRGWFYLSYSPGMTPQKIFFSKMLVGHSESLMH